MKSKIFILFVGFLCNGYINAKSNPIDTIKIASWNIQMTPNIFSPFIEIARKKQKNVAQRLFNI